MTTRSVTHTGPGPPHKTQGSHDIWWAATEWDMTWNTVTSVTNTRDEERDTISQSEGEKALSWPIRSSRSQADNPTGSVTIVTIMWRYCVSRHFLVSSCSRNLGFFVSASVSLSPRPSHCPRHGFGPGNNSRSLKYWQFELWPGHWARIGGWDSEMVLGLMMQLMYDSSWQQS